MSLIENAAPILALALKELLGPALPGSMAFIRCLPGEVARELASDQRFSVLGWRVALVCQTPDETARAITADQAVEWREDKVEAVLLLVDTTHAGAGMDGIYSAAREIAEAELFTKAKALAREKLVHGGKGFADKALSKARRLARNKALSPWREFAYLCRAAYSLEGLGAALPEIGLWPVAVADRPDDDDLEKSARLVERLLAGNRQSAETRVAGLQLPAADAAAARDLAEFLRVADSYSRLDALARLEKREDLWLNRLRPGLFDNQTLQGIRWETWRRANGNRLAWSGLTRNADDRLELRLSLEDSLALAAIQVAKEREDFDRLADNPGDRQAFSRDAKGYIACRMDGKAARVLCQNLLLDLAADWVVHGGETGRWRLKVRADGTPDGKPEFVQVPPTSDEAGRRFVQVSKDFSRWLASSSLGPLAVLYTERKIINDYVNAATAWWDTAAARATLIHTLEVMGVSGQRIGLIVLPTHPLRVAWQQGFDMLVWRHRYAEGAPPTKVAKLLGSLIGAHYPAMLPGFNQGEAFVFADSLGFHAVAMTATDDTEPKATVALLSRLLGDGDAKGEELMAPSVGKSASELLGEEVARYLNLHPETRRVHVHALRPGDAMPAARALGCALRDVEAGEVDEEGDARDEDAKRAFVLDLYPAKGRKNMVGRFLSATAERQRSGAGAVPGRCRKRIAGCCAASPAPVG